MAEHGLDRAQVGAALEQVARERVAQHVGRHAPAETGAVAAARRTIVHSDWRESGPPRGFTKSRPAIAAPRVARAASRGR